MDYREEYKQKLASPKDAVQLVKSGDRVFLGFASSGAYGLMDALWERKDELEDVTLISALLTKSIKPYECTDHPFGFASPFLGPFERNAVKLGVPNAITSFHLSEVDMWMREIGRPTVAFIECSVPDENGYMSYGSAGTCVDSFAVEDADIVVAQVNRHVPYIFGSKDAFIHVSQCDMIVEVDVLSPEYIEKPTDEVTKQISAHVLREIPDGATIQLGIGALSSEIGYGLKEKNDLGIYTEMFVLPMMELIKNGNVTNTKKGFMDGKSVFAFSIGNREMYSFMDHNPGIYAMPFPFVNDSRNIAKNNRMISINSAMEVNIYGEVAADCMAFKQHSACGGQLDFVQGAQWSKGGKSIIALASSMVKNGKRYSKISVDFSDGTAVTTPRGDVQYIATEYGCINLKVLPLQERVKAMISLAHPDFRDELTTRAKDAKLI